MKRSFIPLLAASVAILSMHDATAQNSASKASTQSTLTYQRPTQTQHLLQKTINATTSTNAQGVKRIQWENPIERLLNNPLPSVPSTFDLYMTQPEREKYMATRGERELARQKAESDAAAARVNTNRSSQTNTVPIRK